MRTVTKKEFHLNFFCSQGSIIVNYVIVVTEAIKQTVGEQVVNGLYSSALLIFIVIRSYGNFRAKSSRISEF